MSDDLQAGPCSVIGCDRTATTSRGGRPMCEQCAEEWESVEPLMTDSIRPRSGPLTTAIRRFAMRLILTAGSFCRAIAARLCWNRAMTPKHNPPRTPSRSDKSGSSGNSAAA